MKKAKKVDFKGLKKSMKSDKPKNTAKKAPRKPVKVKTTNKSTTPAKVRSAKRNFGPKTKNEPKTTQIEQKSPQKRKNTQNSRQIKIINIRI